MLATALQMLIRRTLLLLSQGSPEPSPPFCARHFPVSSFCVFPPHAEFCPTWNVGIVLDSYQWCYICDVHLEIRHAACVIHWLDLCIMPKEPGKAFTTHYLSCLSKRATTHQEFCSTTASAALERRIALVRNNHARFSYTTKVIHVPGSTRTRFVARPR